MLFAIEKEHTGKEHDDGLQRIEEKRQWLAHNPAKGHDESETTRVNNELKGDSCATHGITKSAIC
jgi:hypothetical protein